MSKEVADAIREAFVTDYGTLADAIVDSFRHGGENCDMDLIGVIDELANGANKIANAITPPGAVKGNDATGGAVGSLTEAVMGMTAGLVQIANAIDTLADAVKELNQ